MRELKATTIYDAYWKANSVGEGTGILVYLKPDVDKVIEDLEESHKKEVTQLLMEIAELKEKYKELAKLHDKAIQACCDADKVIAHHKYKRCLDKARICEEKSVLPYALVEKDLWKFTSNYWQRWHERWLELADKFKEGK